MICARRSDGREVALQEKFGREDLSWEGWLVLGKGILGGKKLICAGRGVLGGRESICAGTGKRVGEEEMIVLTEGIGVEIVLERRISGEAFVLWEGREFVGVPGKEILKGGFLLIPKLCTLHTPPAPCTW